MQYYDQRQKALKRIIKIVVIILVTIACIAGIYFLVNLNKSEQDQLALSEQKEQQRMLALRPLYKEKSKLESQLAEITDKRNHAVDRSTIIIPLLTDCTDDFVLDISKILQQYDYPAVICISDTYYPGADGCISVEKAKELVNRRWEFVIDISSDINKLTELLLSAGLTKPVAIYCPNKDEYDKSMDFNLPLVIYGNQSDKSLFEAAYGMQTDELFYTLITALDSKKAVIMTGGTLLPREIYDKTMILDILSYAEYMGAESDFQICTYSENAALQAEYSQQQQKVIDETEAEFKSLTDALTNINEQIEKIETSMF